jgi:hypothetical protein
MAILKTTKLHKCEVFPAKNSEAYALSNEAHCVVFAHYTDCLDDPDDADLPIRINRVKRITRLSEEEGSAEGDLVDYSSESSEVVAICDSVWTSVLPEPEPEIEEVP